MTTKDKINELSEELLIKAGWPGDQQVSNLFQHNPLIQQEETMKDSFKEIEITPWPEELNHKALYGLAGEVVNILSPYSEADVAALLTNFLLAFGSCAGGNPHFRASADRHGINENAVLVGETAKGRKGSSWGPVHEIFKLVDEPWALYKTPSGMSSGEGLIWEVRDPINQSQPVKDKGRVTEYQKVEIDSGVTDKRIMIIEAEFAQALKVATRQGNTLSPVLRNAWDGGILQSMTKTNPVRSTNPHISVIGHITM